MFMSVSNDDEISAHIIEIGAVGARLKKLCQNGMILVEDIQTASLIASLPETFSSVTSPFEQREDARFDEVSISVKGYVVMKKNRQHQTSAATSSTANSVRNNNHESKHDSSKFKGKRKKKTNTKSSSPIAGPCTFCKGKYHDVSTCLQKKNKDLNNKLDSIIKHMASGRTNLACESDSDSDFSESMARSATSVKEKSTALIK